MQYAIVEAHNGSEYYVVNAVVFETEFTEPKEILMAYVPNIQVGSGTNVVYVWLNGRHFGVEDSYFTGKWKFYDYN